MKLSISRLVQKEFIQNNNLLLFPNTLKDRMFALVSNGKHNFKVSWQSDGLFPVTFDIFEDVFAIGIDLDFVIVDFSTGIIIYHQHLESFFCEFMKYDGKLFAISEIEIYVIDLKTYKTKQVVTLPEIYEKMTIEDECMIVNCIDGEKYHFRIS